MCHSVSSNVNALQFIQIKSRGYHMFVNRRREFKLGSKGISKLGYSVFVPKPTLRNCTNTGKKIIHKFRFNILFH